MPATPFFDHLYALFGPDLRDVRGAAVGGEIPFSDELINRAIARALARRELAVTALRIESLGEGHLVAHVSVRAPLPEIAIALRIDQQPDLPHSPVLGLRWSLPKFGPLGLLAAPLLSQFKKLPPGIRVEGDRLLVDVAEIVRSRELGDVLRYLRRLNVGTRVGQVLVAFELKA